MKLLYKSMVYFVIGEFSAGSKAPLYSVFSVETDGSSLFVTLSPMHVAQESYSEGVNVPVTYNGVAKSLSASAFTSPLSASFPYSDSVKSLHLGTAVYFGGENHPDGADISWKGSASDPTPALTLSIEGIRGENDNVGLSWSIALPDSALTDEYRAFLTQITYRKYSSENGETRENIRYVSPQKIDGGSLRYYYSVKAGDRVTIFAYAALYSSPDDAAEDYIGLAKAETRELTAAGENQFYQPYDLRLSSPVAGAPVKISWKKPADTVCPYYNTVCELERAVNGGEYALIYSGASESFTDSVGGGWESVSYRVRVSGHSYVSASEWTDTGELGVIKTNVYIGGKPAAAMFVGTPAGIRTLVPIMRVGRG